jgi:hypothetical protein
VCGAGGATSLLAVGVVGSWLADRQPKTTGVTALRGLAVDGKSLRGTAMTNDRKIHPLAALLTLNA